MTEFILSELKTIVAKTAPILYTKDVERLTLQKVSEKFLLLNDRDEINSFLVTLSKNQKYIVFTTSDSLLFTHNEIKSKHDLYSDKIEYRLGGDLHLRYPDLFMIVKYTERPNLFYKQVHEQNMYRYDTAVDHIKF
jgi:hypothetical protein